MDPASGDARQGAAPQIKTVGVVGISDVQQALDGLFAQQIHGR